MEILASATSNKTLTGLRNNQMIIDQASPATDLDLTRPACPTMLRVVDPSGAESLPDDSSAEIEVDPDPFSIALALLGSAVGGAAFLDTRRQRVLAEHQDRRSFEACWRRSRGTVRRFTKQVERFSTEVEQLELKHQPFLFGAVRLRVDRKRHQRLRRLQSGLFTNAAQMTRRLDELSDFLDDRDEGSVTAVHKALTSLDLNPDSYAGVIAASRQAATVLEELLLAVAEGHSIETSGESAF